MIHKLARRHFKTCRVATWLSKEPRLSLARAEPPRNKGSLRCAIWMSQVEPRELRLESMAEPQFHQQVITGCRLAPAFVAFFPQSVGHS